MFIDLEDPFFLLEGLAPRVFAVVVLGVMLENVHVFVWVHAALYAQMLTCPFWQVHAHICNVPFHDRGTVVRANAVVSAEMSLRPENLAYPHVSIPFLAVNFPTKEHPHAQVQMCPFMTREPLRTKLFTCLFERSPDTGKPNRYHALCGR